MVAQKRGRGARGQAVKARPAVEETPAEATPAAETPVAEGNGDAAIQDETLEDPSAEGGEGETAEATESAETTPVVEEKVESGKIMVENLPSSFLFDYQDKLKEIFSKYGDILSMRRGPIIVNEQTTTPTLSAIVEFKNKDSLEKAVSENGSLVGGSILAVSVERGADSAVLVGVPHEAHTDYVRRLFAECGAILQVQEFSKAKYKILRVTFLAKESVEKALKLDRDLRINGFLVTVSKYRDEEEHKAHAANINKQNKRQHPGGNTPRAAPTSPPANRNNYRGRGGFNVRANFRGGRGRGFSGRGGSYPRGGFAPQLNSYMPPAYMPRPGGFMNDGQRPNKRLRQM